MTQEEKLEKAKRLYETANADQKYVLEQLFPELKESEDEKIRKELIAIFKGQIPYTSGEDAKRYIAWLERQDEQKSLDNIAKEVIKDKDTATSFLKSCGIMNENGELADEYKIEQCEQNPIWSEEDRIRITNCIQLIGKTGDGEVEWLKYLESRIIPQPKQEWSEEDEDKMILIEDRFSDYLDYVREDNSLTKYRKYSTKDEIDNLSNWLKSLKERYIWKPSDEQIEALEHFVRSIGESGYASPYENNTKLLYSLLEQLKKLREK